MCIPGNVRDRFPRLRCPATRPRCRRRTYHDAVCVSLSGIGEVRTLTETVSAHRHRIIAAMGATDGGAVGVVDREGVSKADARVGRRDHRPAVGRKRKAEEAAPGPRACSSRESLRSFIVPLSYRNACDVASFGSAA